jgi:hypothetical protein
MNLTAAQLQALDDLSTTELDFIDGVTAGTATASKAVVLGTSKEIATITTGTITTINNTTLNSVNIDAGSSGAAGTVDIFPTTALKGKIALTAADSAGDTTTTIVNASQAAARTYTIPDAGASASFLMTQGAQTVAGVQTYTSPQVADHNTGISAFATGGQGSATALTDEWNNVTTVASAFDSVKLLTAVVGQVQTVKNSGANILSVFPNSSDAINALAADLSIDIPVGGEVTFRAIDATTWETQEAFYSSAPTTQTGGLAVKAVDNASNVDVTISNASHGQATTVSIPDGGQATANFVLDQGAATIAGAKTFTDDLTMTDDDGIILGTSSDLKVEFNSTDSIVTSGPATLLWAGAPSVLDPDPFKFYGITEDFMNPASATASDLHAWTDNNDGGTGTNAFQDAAGGIYNIVTAAADNDYHAMSSVSEPFLFASGKKLWFEARFKVAEATTNESAWWFGLTDTLTTGGFQADAAGPLASYDGALIWKDEATMDIDFETSNAGTQATTTAMATAVTNTWTKVGFYFDGTVTTSVITPYYAVNDSNTLVAGTPQNITLAGLEEMHLVFGVKAGPTAAAETLQVDYIKCIQLR